MELGITGSANISAKSKPIIIMAAVLCLILLITIIYVEINNHKEAGPTTYEFNAETGDVQFKLDSAFEIYDVSLEYGAYNRPQYSNNSKIILFNALELPVKRSEFITIRCKQVGSDPAYIYSVTYEVLHQSETEIMISKYEKSFLIQSETYEVGANER